jgi:hypothetical protein
MRNGMTGNIVANYLIMTYQTKKEFPSGSIEPEGNHLTVCVYLVIAEETPRVAHDIEVKTTHDTVSVEVGSAGCRCSPSCA